jgi:8-oxo-dGTP diphosphatase
MTQPLLVADGDQARTGGADRAATQVAVGVVFDAQGRFLLTSRPAGKAYAGYWEFPGGKVEAGETVAQALARELQEEIGLQVHSVQAWRTQRVDYPHALVDLHFCKVVDWSGTLTMLEGQEGVWTQLPVTVQPILPGTVPVLQWLQDEAASA